MNQGEYLRSAQKKLGMTRAELAQAIGANTRTMNNWYLPSGSKEFRGLPSEARSAIDALLLEFDLQHPIQADWLSFAKTMSETIAARDYVLFPWQFARDLANDFSVSEEATIREGAVVLATCIASNIAAEAIGKSLVPLSNRMRAILARNPHILSEKKLLPFVKSLPLPSWRRRKYESMKELLEVFVSQVPS